MFDTNSRDNLKKSMRVAAYGHIVSGGNVMRSGYAELVSHFSTIIHNTDGWEYAGVYVVFHAQVKQSANARNKRK